MTNSCQISGNWSSSQVTGVRVTLSACLPLPSLFVRYTHLIIMISLSRERGLLRLRH